MSLSEQGLEALLPVEAASVQSAHPGGLPQLTVRPLECVPSVRPSTSYWLSALLLRDNG